MSMILKALLKKVVRYVDGNRDEFGCKFILQCVTLSNQKNGTEQTLEDVIMSLDVSDIHVLRDYVPLAFPKHLRPPIELNITQNSLGAWRVDPIEKRKKPRG